jgi:hypothetical protein
VREFFLANACYWMEEFHFDGFRLDALWNDDFHHTLLVALTPAKLQIFLEPRCVRLILIERRQDLVCVKDIG